MDDFASLTSKNGIDKDKKSKSDQGQKREWLKVFETLPPQMLNAYGPAKFAKLSDKSVWTALNEPQNSGAVYMTELCSLEAERRGIGINRMLHAVKLFCEYQKEPAVKVKNEALLLQSMCTEIYAEIDLILPSLTYCLAPKKAFEKKGASSLRASGIEESTPIVGKSETELDVHAAALYNWFDTASVSRIRMLMHWQSGAGLSFVAGVHHRAVQCFRYFGGVIHAENDPTVSLSAFQEAIKTRHRLGSSGISVENDAATSSNDFASLV